MKTKAGSEKKMVASPAMIGTPRQERSLSAALGFVSRVAFFVLEGRANR